MTPQTSTTATAPDRVRLTSPLSDLLDLTGRRAIVTGGAGGIGLATARGLARRGADVLLGVRDTARGEQVRRSLAEEGHLRGDQITIAALDLLDLDSVRRFAADAASGPLDLLILNAGIANVPLRLSPQGLESQFATNHLGHFALAGQLLAALAQGTDPRVVTVSSTLYKVGRLDVGDPAGGRRYSPGRAYSRSKLANTLFALELRRRLAAAGSPVRSFVAHPGMARTPLHTSYPSPMTRLGTKLVAGIIGREPGPAAVAVVAAAASTRVDPRLFWGPTGSRSQPEVLGVPFTPAATDPAAAEWLWAASVRLAGVEYLT